MISEIDKELSLYISDDMDICLPHQNQRSNNCYNYK